MVFNGYSILFFLFYNGHTPQDQATAVLTKWTLIGGPKVTKNFVFLENFGKSNRRAILIDSLILKEEFIALKQYAFYC